jgi:hypothetical protein
VDYARRAEIPFRVKILIIDPKNIELCERNARFRSRYSSVSDANGELWTLERVLRELYATILAACWHKEKSDLLDIRVRLASTYSTYRCNIFDSAAFVTQYDPRAEGELFPRGSVPYRRHMNDFLEAWEQARSVPLGLARNIVLGVSPGFDEVRNLFIALGLSLGTFSSDQSLEIIMRKAGIDVLVPTS